MNSSEESKRLVSGKITEDEEEEEFHIESETDFSKFMLSQSKPDFVRILSFGFLFYLYLTIPVQGNFLFRHKWFKYFVLISSFGFFLFTLRLPPLYYISLIIPVVFAITDYVLLKKRDRGLNFMIFEIWGILMGCVWIINLMLVMMDILLFLSNIFGVSILLFTCSFIAIGNNVAGGFFS
jgi:hypothetical protein